MSSSVLSDLLHTTFGFSGFRANQKQVCEAAASGRDVLLVMPTGAGKSLCYQLPALARGGTALVISPLIALMDDQALKLQSLGLRVGRIHSGMGREQSRAVCREYLDGNLQFLFIAPERLRVPGFADMLRKRPLALIAVDEAHCISQWGHDFRPDYRNLARYLHGLRPAPILALTATATPQVQRDIVVQLQLDHPAEFITGFRRSNLAIEVLELSRPQRQDMALQLLHDRAARPAIVYAPSRREAEEVTAHLRPHFPVAAYHAGLPPAVRESVQASFLASETEVVVATIAFGMGIDKADVRSVLHIAMPASVESFYQEIGRAGRDGKPARAVLMYSYADRRAHEYFLNRDYPPATTLHRVAAALRSEPAHADDLRLTLRMEIDEFAPALDKLVAQGAAEIDFGNHVRGTAMAVSEWLPRYESQVNFRQNQIDSMMRLASSAECRMSALIRHFGDRGDSTRLCGMCDFCSPERAVAGGFRNATANETVEMHRILAELDGRDQGRSVGKLYEAVHPRSQVERRAFDAQIDALARAGYLAAESATFKAEDGHEVTYRKVSLTHEGRGANAGEALASIQMRESAVATPKRSEMKAMRKAAKDSGEMQPLSEAQKQLDADLRAWRRGIAADLKQPAFCVFGDKVLRAIVTEAPASRDDLLQVSGLGRVKVERWGDAILAIVRGGSQGADAVQVPGPGVAKPRIVADAEPIVRGAARNVGDEPATPAAQADRALKVWRMHEARRLGVPPFVLLLDRTIRGIVAAVPRSPEDLRTVDGLSPEWVERHGHAVVNTLTPLYSLATPR